ncbi:ACL4-like protein, partial [Mya arenaria]
MHEGVNTEAAAQHGWIKDGPARVIATSCLHGHLLAVTCPFLTFVLRSHGIGVKIADFKQCSVMTILSSCFVLLWPPNNKLYSAFRLSKPMTDQSKYATITDVAITITDVAPSQSLMSPSQTLMSPSQSLMSPSQSLMSPSLLCPANKDRKKKLRELAKDDKKKDQKAKYSLDQLLDKAESCIDKFEYEMAQKFCQRGLEMEPDNVRALETSGALLIDLGNMEAAKQYMNLGQLFEGAQSVECFQKGIELMLKEKELREKAEVATACGDGVSACGGGDRDKKGGATDRMISEAYLSIAEIYMTDCCFDDGAEEKCRSNIEKAITEDETNPDALQLMASFLLSKEKNEEARESIKKSVSLWLPDYKASEQPEASTSDPIECSQSFESRLAAGKILIEVGEHEENDEIVDVWYLIGWANHLLGEEGKDTA